MSPRPTIPLDDIPEAEWQKNVIDLARLFGWRIAHFRPAQTTKGWRTPVAADGAGWPDLFLVRERCIAIELKREKGKLSDDQAVWLTALRQAGIETYLIRPRHLEQLADVLRYRGRIDLINQPLIEELDRELGKKAA